MLNPIRLVGVSLCVLLLIACAADDAGLHSSAPSEGTGSVDSLHSEGVASPGSGGEDTSGEQSASQSAPPVSGTTSPTEGGEALAITWYGDIAAMLDTHCGACHLPGGQGLGDFTDRSVVEAFAPAILSSVAAGRMPPPASDPDCHDYIGADRWVVSDDFIPRFQEWIDTGFPVGDEADYEPVPPIAMQLEAPDLEVFLPHAYTPTFSDPANPGNEYRCFAVEHGQDEDFYINAMAPIIDQTELVHHIVLFKARRDDIPEEHDPETGYDCIDMTFFVGSGGAADIISGDSGMISAWAPGSQAIHFGPDTGIRMTPDHVFIFQMHYFDGATGEIPADRSGYQFNTMESARTEVLMAPFGPNRFTIPAGAESHRETETVSLPLNLRLHGVMPHMHYLGDSYRMWVRRRGQEEMCIVESERYDFDNQLTYMFEEPIRIPLGAEIGFTCTWNNSTSNPNLIHDPPIDIRYGERTDEEMCYGFSLISIGR